MAEKLDQTGVPSAKAVLIVLIADAAWGAPYPFCEDLPCNPLDDGADMMVVSVHKTMAAPAQGSPILARGKHVDCERLDRLVPGQRIDGRHVKFLQEALRTGVVVGGVGSGGSDPTLRVAQR